MRILLGFAAGVGGMILMVGTPVLFKETTMWLGIDTIYGLLAYLCLIGGCFGAYCAYSMRPSVTR